MPATIALWRCPAWHGGSRPNLVSEGALLSEDLGRLPDPEANLGHYVASPPPPRFNTNF